jgi:hypothetical protein
MSEDTKALIARLRNVSAVEWCEPLCAEAADALQAAEARVKELEEALRAYRYATSNTTYPENHPIWAAFQLEEAALAQQEK